MGIEQALREMLPEPEPAVLHGTVVTAEAPNTVPGWQKGPPVVEVMLQDGRPVTCFVDYLGAGTGQGLYPPPLVAGQSVVVELPADDVNEATTFGVASHTLTNPMGAAALARLGWLLQGPTGVELRSAEGLPAHGLVLGTFLQDFASWVAAFDTLIATVAVVPPATTPAETMAAVNVVTAAALAFQTATAALPFGTNLATSAAAGLPPSIGGPPHATGTHKATT